MQITINIDTTNIKLYLKEKFDRDFQDSELEEFLVQDVETVYCQEFFDCEPGTSELPESLSYPLYEWFYTNKVMEDNS